VNYPNNDYWKDDYLARPNIFHAEFLTMPQEHKLWILEHKDIFYNKGEQGFCNLLHRRHKELAKKVKNTIHGSTT
jgi:hypothetical protein